MRPQIFGQDADILASRAGTTGLHGGETTSHERELFSQTWKKSEVGDSAEPK